MSNSFNKPTTTSSSKVKAFIRTIGKYFTMFLFFILPKRVCRIFVEVSVYILFLSLRSKELKPNVDIDKLNVLLERNYGSEFVELPSYTLSWFWPDNYLNQTIELEEGVYSFKEVIRDDKLVSNNISKITLNIIRQLPRPMWFKLGLGDSESMSELRGNIERMLSGQLATA